MLSSHNLGFKSQFPSNFESGTVLRHRKEVGVLGNPETQFQKTSFGGELLRLLPQKMPQKQNGGSSLNTHTKSENLPPEWPFKPKLIGTYVPRDRSREYEWLRTHRDEYANQWVALNGNNLVSHGPEFKEVIASAKSKGVPDALMIFVEPPNTPSFIRIEPSFV